ncbi:MAG: MarR family transcriptional regulator [Sphingomonadales bacterium]|nr:MAG: MarR family transcriptional regulator [Sphingomonadales bacterium]
MSVAFAEKHDGALGDHADVRLWLRLLSCTMAIEKSVQRVLGERGTTLPRFDVMAALERAEDGLTMGALSQALLVSNGNVTQLVQKLAADALVQVAPDPNDRRVFRVRLTEDGRAHFAELAAVHHDRIHALLAALPRDDHAGLYAALGALKTSIASAEELA